MYATARQQQTNYVCTTKGYGVVGNAVGFEPTVEGSYPSTPYIFDNTCFKN